MTRCHLAANSSLSVLLKGIISTRHLQLEKFRELLNSA